MKIEDIYKEKFLEKFPKPHYLLDKDMEKWDEYDWSNFRSILRRITNEN